MKKYLNKKIIIFLLLFCFIIFCLLGIIFSQAKKDSNVNAETSFTMEEGASFRSYWSTPNCGITFGATMPTSTSQDVIDNVKLFLTPLDYLQEFNIESLDDFDYITAFENANKKQNQSNGYIIVSSAVVYENNLVNFRAGLKNIKSNNLNRKFFGVFFYQDNNTYVYAKTKQNFARSMANVSSNFYSDNLSVNDISKSEYFINQSIKAITSSQGEINYKENLDVTIQNPNCLDDVYSYSLSYDGQDLTNKSDLYFKWQQTDGLHINDKSIISCSSGIKSTQISIGAFSKKIDLTVNKLNFSDAETSLVDELLTEDILSGNQSVKITFKKSGNRLQDKSFFISPTLIIDNNDGTAELTLENEHIAGVNSKNFDITYTINYINYGGEISNYLEYYTKTSPTFSLPIASKEHFNFLGWANNEENTLTEIKNGSFGDLTLYAAYSPIKYNGELYNSVGAESKYVLPTPQEQDLTKFITFATVQVETFRENGYTRLSSFSFNVSDNSWYNVELNESGDAILYARFNGVEKYNRHLFNVLDEGILVDGKITYDVAILKNNQYTCLFINDNPVCYFTEQELVGYPTLTSIEVTAAADRLNSGEYNVKLNDVYYETQESKTYNLYLQRCNDLDFKDQSDFSFISDSGYESKRVIFNTPESGYEDFVYYSTISILDTGATFLRPSSYAFNSWNGSWYNIQMDDRKFYLYATFNGIVKDTYLFDADSVVVNGKISYSIKLIKRGQATYFFVNEKLITYYTETEMAGAPFLTELEVTTTSYNYLNECFGNYSVTFTNNILQQDQPIKNQILIGANGEESKYVYFKNNTEDFVLTSNVKVSLYCDNYTRTSAFAFNSSDSSWYNIEMQSDGNFYLYATFNGINKYNIYLFNKNDYLKDGVISYTTTILKKGQATYLFVNDRLVCSYSAEEMSGNTPLDSIEVTARADRPNAPYIITISSQLNLESSNQYQKYWDLINNN